MSQILVTGANGQLGREIRKLQSEFNQAYTFTDIGELDLTDASAVGRYLASLRPGYIINCAAYTDVDGAESDEKRAMLLNRDAVAHLVAGSEPLQGTRIIHISTDYVFRGDLPRPLREDDPPGPLSVYGKTKLEGERMLRDHPGAIVIRTSWLYSMFGRNFVKTLINRMDQHAELRVVYDQVGTPTYAEDLARTIMQIIADVESGKHRFVSGIFNYSNEGVCSWYDLAREVCRLIGCKGTVLPIETAEYPLPASRPAYSVLNKAKIRETYGVEVPYWRESLEKCIMNLL